MKDKIINNLRFMGLVAGLGFVLTVIISAHFNPWFDINKHSFSHLGASSATNPIPYNIGMGVVGFMIILYSMSFIIDMKRKLEIISGTLLAMSGLFLIFVGIFHMGTKPHNFVSAYFFIQGWLAFYVIIINMILIKCRYWIALLICHIFELIVLAFGIFPSVATYEAFAIFALFMKYVILLNYQLKEF